MAVLTTAQDKVSVTMAAVCVTQAGLGHSATSQSAPTTAQRMECVTWTPVSAPQATLVSVCVQLFVWE